MRRKTGTRRDAAEAPRDPRRGRRLAILGAALVLLAAAAYARALQLPFITLDDPDYVTSNAVVRAGLTARGIAWALTTTAAANWHPLTWISLMADASIGGAGPRVFHATNLVLHLANTLLLFLLLEAITRRAGRSAFVAGLFALHPLHVESVVWVAERKDVLSTLFWLLTTIAYVRWTRAPGPRRYFAVIACYALGLMAKPMLVSLPFVLLLLDSWPLGRRGRGGAAMLDRIREKGPLFVMSGLSCAITLIAQRGAIGSLDLFPLPVRAANALVASAGYIAHMFWPFRLAIYYPHPQQIPGIASLLVALAALAGPTAASIAWRRTRPWFLTGWFWYLVTLAPVIGIVQVGHQAMADRYTYIPLIGLFIVVSWGGADLAGLFVPRIAGSGAPADPRGAPEAREPRGAIRASGETAPEPGSWTRATSFSVLGVAALAVLGGLALLTLRQVGYWRNSITLFERAIAVTGPNSLAQNSLGAAYVAEGRFAEAAAHYLEAYRIGGYQGNHFNATVALVQAGKGAEAAALAREELRLWPGHVRTHTNLGLAAMVLGAPAEAARHFEEALRIDPGFVDARLDLGMIYMSAGRYDEAAAAFTEVLRLNPADAATRRLLEEALSRRSPQGR